MYITKIFYVAFWVYLVQNESRYDTCWKFTFYFLDHMKFNNVYFIFIKYLQSMNIVSINTNFCCI